jgi:hypothetical protein
MVTQMPARLLCSFSWPTDKHCFMVITGPFKDRGGREHVRRDIHEWLLDIVGRQRFNRTRCPTAVLLAATW